jgi:hypothetical protein
MIGIDSKGSFSKAEAFLKRMKQDQITRVLERYAQEALTKLADATPLDTSETAHSWYYEITKQHGQHTISFHNSHMTEGVPVAVLIQYGHATRTGGYVEGRDFINPVIRPIFDRIAADAWKEVTK